MQEGAGRPSHTAVERVARQLMTAGTVARKVIEAKGSHLQKG
jgi:hypothetical protein